jgi:signal recognition particle receptor subunit beta
MLEKSIIYGALVENIEEWSEQIVDLLGPPVLFIGPDSDRWRKFREAFPLASRCEELEQNVRRTPWVIVVDNEEFAPESVMHFHNAKHDVPFFVICRKQELSKFPRPVEKILGTTVAITLFNPSSALLINHVNWLVALSLNQLGQSDSIWLFSTDEQYRSTYRRLASCIANAVPVVIVCSSDREAVDIITSTLSTKRVDISVKSNKANNEYQFYSGKSKQPLLTAMSVAKSAKPGTTGIYEVVIAKTSKEAKQIQASAPRALEMLSIPSIQDRGCDHFLTQEEIDELVNLEQGNTTRFMELLSETIRTNATHVAPPALEELLPRTASLKKIVKEFERRILETLSERAPDQKAVSRMTGLTRRELKYRMED